MNDIKHLDVKARMLAALSGQSYPVTPTVEAIEPEELSSDEEPDSPTPPDVDDRGSTTDPVDAEAIAPAIAPAPVDAVDPAITPATAVIPTPATPVAPVTLADHPALYAMRAYLASRVAAKTRRTMAQGLERIARLLNTTAEAVPWHELRFEHTDAIRAKLLGGQYSAGTVKLTLQALKGVLRQCKRLRLMSEQEFGEATDWDGVGGVTLPPGRELSQVDIGAIQARLKELEGSSYGAFLEAVFALCLGLGLRGDEASNLPLTGFDPAAGELRLIRKGNKEHIVPLGPAELRALKSWVEFRRFYERRIQIPNLLLRVQPNDWVRDSLPACSLKHIEHICRRMAAEAKIAHFTPHDLRRTFCTRAIRASGGDLAMVQELMAHANIATTKRYDKRGDEERAEARRRWNIWRPPEEAPQPPKTDPDLDPDLPDEPEPTPSPPPAPRGLRVIRGGG